MSEMNPYRVPDAPISDLHADQDLAGLGERFAAALIDGVIAMLVMLPLAWFGGYFKAVMNAAMAGGQPPFTLVLLWAVIGFVVFLAIQGYPLYSTAQTWGKRILGIRVVDMQGQKPSFGRLISRRYLPINLAALVPLVGNLIILIDILLIFRQDRRCGHDLIADTRVVKAR